MLTNLSYLVTVLTLSGRLIADLFFTFPINHQYKTECVHFKGTLFNYLTLALVYFTVMIQREKQKCRGDEEVVKELVSI